MGPRESCQAHARTWRGPGRSGRRALGKTASLGGEARPRGNHRAPATTRRLTSRVRRSASRSDASARFVPAIWPSPRFGSRNRRMRAPLATTINTAALWVSAPVGGSTTSRAASVNNTIERPNPSRTFWPMIRLVISARPWTAFLHRRNYVGRITRRGRPSGASPIGGAEFTGIISLDSNCIPSCSNSDIIPGVSFTLTLVPEPSTGLLILAPVALIARSLRQRRPGRSPAPGDLAHQSTGKKAQRTNRALAQWRAPPRLERYSR